MRADLGDGARPALQEGALRRSVAGVVELLRDGPPSEAPARAGFLLSVLRARPDAAQTLREAAVRLVSDHRILETLTEAGVPSTRGFASELLKRLGRRVLPELLPQSDIRLLIRALFHRRGDAEWIEVIPEATWIDLVNACGIAASANGRVHPELADALRILAHHVGSLGLQSEIARRLDPEQSRSPFLSLSDHVLRYIRGFEDGITGNEPAYRELALATVERCRAEVHRLREGKRRFGTSLRLTGLSFRLGKLLDRLELLLHLTAPGDCFSAGVARLVRELVLAECTRNRLRPHVRERADLLALQVVEHAAEKGSKYVTRGRRDYVRFLVSSLGGGLIVAFFALIKVGMDGWKVPLALEGFLYGLNYSLCFVLIHLTGATLATKQPAMTANTLARAVGEPGRRNFGRLEDLVVRVSRSQFISFVGNVAMAMPVAFVLSALFFRWSGMSIASEAKAASMLSELHPWQSGTLLFAAVAGVCLFAAGVVSGWVDNRNVYGRLSERLAAHPRLVARLGKQRAARVGGFLQRNLGIIAGNVFLGFALGSMGTFGEILGLPLDIRHIAFASAHLAAAIEVLGVTPASVWPIAVGIALIGLVNFVVSFGLSLGMALEARRMTRDEGRLVLRHLLHRSVRRPFDWFFPPSDSQVPISEPEVYSAERSATRAA